MLTRKNKFILITLVLFAFPCFSHVQAECDYTRQAELSRIAGNVQFSYTYEANEVGNPEFTVIISNLTNDIYIKDNENDAIISGIGDKRLSYSNGSSIEFEIYSNDSNCAGEMILSKQINLPHYNFYSQSEECQDYPEFAYCQMWMNSDISLSNFNKAFNKYKQDLQNKQGSNIEKEGAWERFLTFVEENLIILIICLIGIIILIIGFIFRKRLRRR